MRVTARICQQLSASRAWAKVPRQELVGLVSVKGSANNHVAIITRAMDLLAVKGAQELPYEQVDDADLVMDGYRGELTVHSGRELRRRYDSIVAQKRELERTWITRRLCPA